MSVATKKPSSMEGQSKQDKNEGLDTKSISVSDFCLARICADAAQNNQSTYAKPC